MEDKFADNVFMGRNAVIEAIKADVPIDVIWISRKARGMEKIRAMASERGLVVKITAEQKLERFGKNNQGVVALLSAVIYHSLEDIINISEKQGTKPFLLLADGIEDPHNLGALIRTAEAVGVDGLILPKRRSASMTSIISKTSAGAVSKLPIARVSNLASTIDILKSKNIWVYGADMDGECWCSTSFEGGAALVVGSEGKGLSRLIRERCDKIISLPMLGQINSLNVSVAGGILMYEMMRQRNGIIALNS